MAAGRAGAGHGAARAQCMGRVSIASAARLWNSFSSCHASYLELKAKTGVLMFEITCGLMKHSHGCVGCACSHERISPPSSPNVRFCIWKM